MRDSGTNSDGSPRHFVSRSDGQKDARRTQSAGGDNHSIDEAEMRDLEEKTRAIVGVLSDLEGETRRQREMGDRLEEGRDAILSLASELSGIARKLADAIDLLQRSTLADDLTRLDGKIESVRGVAELSVDSLEKAEKLCCQTADMAANVDASIQAVSERIGGVETACSELLEELRTLKDANASRNDDLIRRLDNLEGVIGRIDRNTQKGFGKERG